MMNRIFALLLAVCMIFSLAACGNKEEQPTVTTTTTTAETTTTVNTDTSDSASTDESTTTAETTTTVAVSDPTKATTTTTVATNAATTTKATTTTTKATTTTVATTTTTTAPTTSFQSVAHPLKLVDADWESAKLADYNGAKEMQVWYLLFKDEMLSFIGAMPALDQMTQEELDEAYKKDYTGFIKKDGVFYSVGRGDDYFFDSYTEENNVITIQIEGGAIVLHRLENKLIEVAANTSSIKLAVGTQFDVYGD